MGRGRGTTLKINTGHCSALHGWDPGPNIRETRVWSPFPSFPGIHFFFFLPYSSPTRSRSKGIPPTVAGSFIISGESSTGTFYGHFFVAFRLSFLLSSFCPATFLSGCPGAVLCTNVILGMTKGERARGERRRWGNRGGKTRENVEGVIRTREEKNACASIVSAPRNFFPRRPCVRAPATSDGGRRLPSFLLSVPESWPPGSFRRRYFLVK